VRCTFVIFDYLNFYKYYGALPLISSPSFAVNFKPSLNFSVQFNSSVLQLFLYISTYFLPATQHPVPSSQCPLPILSYFILKFVLVIKCLNPMKLQLRINGVAPAWPVLLDYPHPFYNPEHPDMLGSASYSVIYTDEARGRSSEILIDAGHNTVPFLLKNGNRIPDAIILTHGHADHILGVDWLVQSRHYSRDASHKKMPVYCTRGVWETLMTTYPYLEPDIEFHQFLPGITTAIHEMEGMQVTPFPVFHGKSALGATLLLIENEVYSQKPLVITGDLLCPLLRKRDWGKIAGAEILCIDTNNRFPLPESNHTSFARNSQSEEKVSQKLREWFDFVKLTDLILPHLDNKKKESTAYFNEFINDWNSAGEIPHTIIDFLQAAPIPDVYLLHYFGIYDSIHYNEELLNQTDLREWANKLLRDECMEKVKVHIPAPGDFIELRSS
jgi:glyoxylase-like metal-dependent hydrolase (beta-lactamase superfamily II)